MSHLQLFTVGVVSMLLVGPVWPQGSTTTVRGNVRDQSEAAVSGAVVTLTNTATGIASKATTNETGFYIFPGVIPATYNLSAEAPGFQVFDAVLTVQVQQVAVVDPVLKVGQTTTRVEVVDVTPILTTDHPTLCSSRSRSSCHSL